MRDVTISKVMNGYVVKVGCQTLVYETQGSLLGALGEYLANPEETEKRFTAKYGYATAMTPPPPLDIHYDNRVQQCEAAPRVRETPDTENRGGAGGYGSVPLGTARR